MLPVFLISAAVIQQCNLFSSSTYFNWVQTQNRRTLINITWPRSYLHILLLVTTNSNAKNKKIINERLNFSDQLQSEFPLLFSLWQTTLVDLHTSAERLLSMWLVSSSAAEVSAWFNAGIVIMLSTSHKEREMGIFGSFFPVLVACHSVQHFTFVLWPTGQKSNVFQQLQNSALTFIFRIQ